MTKMLPMLALAGTVMAFHHVQAEKLAKTPPMPPAFPEMKALPAPTPTPQSTPVVVIETSKGRITIKLWQDRAPGTVKNFLKYVDDDFYKGTVFHRVIGNFMIQGGGFSPDMQQKKTNKAIKNEASAKGRNTRGTIAMARTADLHSATSQFFINLKHNVSLDHKNETPRGFGYCAFGEVIDGMDVVDTIAKVRTGRKGRFSDVPVEPVLIKSITRKATNP